ncbi:MAG: hypothetical protein LC099_10115 [Anaerolineales bacterium]|nr:hypothetical protein [Anaerolineales bacterium]
MHGRNRKIISLLVGLMWMFACVPSFGTSAPPIPTFDVNAPLTVIVQTAEAAAVQTKRAMPPTPTPTLATNTPFPTITPSPTVLFVLPTATPLPTETKLLRSNDDLACQVLSAEPTETLKPSQKFTAKWTLANIGRSAWDANSADYLYIDGYRLHIQDGYDFPANVSPGNTVELRVGMQAPPSPGKYSTFWVIRMGKTYFCKMQLDINVAQ